MTQTQTHAVTGSLKTRFLSSVIRADLPAIQIDLISRVRTIQCLRNERQVNLRRISPRPRGSSNVDQVARFYSVARTIAAMRINFLTGLLRHGSWPRTSTRTK